MTSIALSPLGKARRWWSERYLRNEGALCVVLGAVFGVWQHVWSHGWVDDLMRGDHATVYATLASISGSLLGLMIASASIIAGLVDKPRVRAIQRSGTYSYVWKTVISPVRWLGVTTLLAVAALLADRENAMVPDVRAALVTAGLIALVRIARALWILEALLRVLQGPRDDGVPQP